MSWSTVFACFAILKFDLQIAGQVSAAPVVPAAGATGAAPAASAEEKKVCR